MPLTALDLLARVEALTGFVDIAGRLHALRVRDRGRGSCFAPGGSTNLAAQQVVQCLGGAVGLLLGVVVVGGLVRQEVVRQVLPHPIPVRHTYRIALTISRGQLTPSRYRLASSGG